ncbi:hypothetical protein NW762_010897 [Fusarium torreyae]|uniref:Uncharacterized protein n=1 Tax=Fusarium torreyae TaxID=1237075 RepID=A0A9W8RT30_9HYPO|nr:hypothetical protein NW762_010897 [Fusarium torreyae]
MRHSLLLALWSAGALSYKIHPDIKVPRQLPEDAPSSGTTSSGGPELDNAIPTTGTTTGIFVETSGDASGPATLPATDSVAPADETTQEAPATTEDVVNVPTTESKAPVDETTAPADPATGTEQGQDTKTATDETVVPVDTTAPGTTDAVIDNTQTGSVGTENPAQTGPETTGPAPEQSSETIPADQQTQSQGTEALPATTNSGDVTESQSVIAPVDSTDVPTGTPGPQDTTTEIPEETTGPQTQDATPNETTPLAADTTEGTQPADTQPAEPVTTDTNAPEPTTEGDDATTQPAPENSDMSAAEPSTAPEGPSTDAGPTTADGPATTDGNNDVPSTTKGDDLPPATGNPVTSDAPGVTSGPVVTDLPDDFAPTTVSNHPEWTTNTWITTTSGDSSEPTVVPVIVGCKNCGGKGSGIILFGFPNTPGTWFKPPGLPKIQFPCIPPACDTPPNTESDGDDDDDDDDDDDEKSSATCTDKVTVTDCFVACTTYTGPAGDTITPDCQTTCTKTHTGCSVTGVTTTSEAAACGPSGDSECNGECSNPNMESTSTDEELLERRGLVKRGKKSGPSDIGGCAPFAQMPQFPEYPGGSTVLDNDGDIVSNNSPLKDIKRWWLTTWNQCVPTLSGGYDAAKYKADKPAGDGSRPSIDHVYEKSMLLDFFRNIIDNSATAKNVKGQTAGTFDKVSCSDMEAYGGAGTNGANLLQTVFDAYPGAMASAKKKPAWQVRNAQYLEDFIGMDQWTNGDAKGFVAGPEGVTAIVTKDVDSTLDTTASTNDKTATTNIERRLGRLEKIAIGIEMFADSEAVEAMKRQNQRLWSRLQDIDDNAKNCMKDDAVKNGLWSFADAYKKYMNNRFDGSEVYSINKVVDDSKTKLIKALQSDLTAAASISGITPTALATWKRRMTNMEDTNRVWSVSVTWDWTFVTKRDGDGLSCERPIPTTSDEPTTFTTMTRTSSDDTTTGDDATTTGEETTKDETTTAEETTSKDETATSTAEETTTKDEATTKDETASSTEEATTSTEETTTTTSQEPIRLTDLPTLTKETPPEGSSCAHTATITMCNQGTGHHGDACLTTESCDSWVNTKTTSTTTPSPTPTLAKPDAGQNTKNCYNSGQKANHGSIQAAAESFCRDVVADTVQGPVWSNYKLEEKKQPSRGYHFKLTFQVKDGCIWNANYDDCMRYMKVPIDSCNCGGENGKQGGYVENNCIMAKVDPNSGV